MTHDQAVADQLAEGYVAGTLTPEMRDAFEAHFFECADCFADVEDIDRLRVGVRLVAASGELAPPAVTVEPTAAPMPTWMWWSAAAVMLTVAAGAAAMVRQQRSVADQLSDARRRVLILEDELARVQTRPDAVPEGNVPVVILQTTRAAAIITPLNVTGATRFVIWIDDAPIQPHETADLAIADGTGRVVERVSNLRRNDQHAAVASFPAAIDAGQYTLTLRVDSAVRATYRLVISH